MAATNPPVATVDREPTNLPWIMMNDSLGEDGGQFAVGGVVFVATAGAALNIGDAVFISGVGTVNKSVTAADHQKRCGIVVGPVARAVVSSFQKVIQRINDVGLQAAATNDPVLVCFGGLCYAVADAAITVGVAVAPSTTVAGRVRPATNPVVAAGATAVTSTAANGAIITGDGFNRIIGMAFDASAAAGNIIRVLVAFS